MNPVGTEPLVPPRSGRALIAGGSGTIFKIWSEQTGGSVSIVEHPIDPGVLVPPHVHTHEDQISLIVEGTVEMLVGDRTLHCETGAYVVKPRHLVHTFWNATQDPARLVEISVPGGAEQYMVQLFERLSVEGSAADPDEIAALAARFGITLLPALGRDLCTQYGLRPMGR